MTTKRSRLRGCLIFIAILVMVLVAGPAWPGSCQHAYQALVIAVHDGDTITVLPDDKRDSVTIRVNHLDTPELEYRDRHGNLRWPNQPYGQQARAALLTMAWGEEVTICPQFESYGRTGATVFLNGQDMAEHMAALGLAWVSCRATCRDVRGAADRAKTAGRGLWSDPNPRCRWWVTLVLWPELGSH